MFIINRIKKYLPYIVIITAGLVVAAVSFYFLNMKYGSNINTKSVPVLARTLGVHDEIKYSDLKTIKVASSKDTSLYVNSYEEAVGNVALSELRADEPIMKAYISPKKVLQGKEYVTIKVDYARTGGAKPGDIVDVYRVITVANEFTLTSSTELVLSDVTVVEVTNSEGVGDKESGGMGVSLTKGTIKTEVVKLCVKSGQASKLVPGSIDPNSGLVLVVKK